MTDADDAPAAPDAPIQRRQKPAALRALRVTWEWAKSIQLAIVLFLLVRAFFVEAFKIPSGSMEGTLLVGDFLLVNKMLYGAEVPFIRKHLPALREPALGDVVVFQWPEDPTKNFVKRLVGLPADTIQMRRGVLYRNGKLQRELYALRSEPGVDPGGEDFRWQRDFVVPGVDVRAYHPSRNNWGPLVVPDRHYFMLGDNRDNSLDSRYWGFVPDSLVRGSPIFVYYSYSPDSGASLDWLTRVRWQRLGELIR
ncbi:MAG: signal peptidase I [Gemmatimonadaceae bacterium]